MSHHAFFDFAWTVDVRRGVLQRLIGSFKFHHQRAGGDVLAALLAESVPPFPTSVVVVPIPTIRAHVRQRGYDHALVLARGFAKRRGVVVRQLLVRQHQAVQHTSDRATRIEQARTAFGVTGRIDPSVTYVIVDDIITTGATVQQAARVLKEAGAGGVWVVAVGRQATQSRLQM